MKIFLRSLPKLLKSWRFLSFYKLIYLPRTFKTEEKRLIIFLLIIILLSGGGLGFRLYVRATETVPTPGGEYTEGLLKQPRTINPLYTSTNDTDRDISALIFSRLITYSGNGDVIPDLLASYDIDEDGKIYTLTLRDDAYWHDGTVLSADDVLFTIGAIQNPQYQSPLRPNWQGVEAERIDERTIRLTLRTPYTPFIENLQIGIIPKHLWEDVPSDQALLHELNLKPVGSGPYEFEQFKQQKDGSLTWYRVKRNSRYFRQGPYLKRITFRFFQGEDEIISAWRREVIDGFGPVPRTILPELNSEHITLSSVQIPRLFGIFFNEQKSEILADKTIREAIARAINKKEITEQAVFGGAIPSESPLPPLFGTIGNDTEHYPYNPEAAQALLVENGWSDTDEDGILEKEITLKDTKKKQEVKLEFILTTSDWPDLLRTADLIKEMLTVVGINVIVEKRSFAELESLVIRPRDFEMLLFGQVYGYEPDPFAFWHSSQIKDPGLNITEYASKTVDDLLEEARISNDPITRLEKYSEFQNQLITDLPAFFLFSQLYLYLQPSYLRGINITKISLPADRFNEVNTWYTRTRRVFRTTQSP